MKDLNFTGLISAITLSAALTACGGGGGGSDTSSTSTPTAPTTPSATISSFSATGPTANTRLAVVTGQSIYLNWSSANANTCTLSGASSGSVAGSGQQVITAQSVTAATVNSYTLTCGSASASASITVLPARTTIPDTGLQAALTAMGMTVSSDGTIDTTAAMAVTDLEITQNYGIVNLTGLSSFQGLTKLVIQQNAGLTNVSDVSSLTGLTFLDIWMGAFTSIDVSKLISLQTLGISQIVGLSTVDISKLTALTELDFQNDNNDPTSPWGVTQGLTSLDISHNVNLQKVYIGFNLLTSIDTSKNVSLQEAWFEGNPFTSLDFSKNTNVDYVIAYGCKKLSNLNVASTNNGQVLTRLSIDDTALTSVHVGTAVSSYNTWISTATATQETQLDGAIDNHYVNGNVGMWLPVGLTFTQ
ncbi:MAG: hypothetical protein JO171_13530 [Paludibacterium sp.]|uniref:hypothetical protein n=1 Tax=Paludibacterium sp. TaxID=1917523 RepID=UPI0025F32A65|nr:hypothetical protein [Paludibacterium sp.]MBV8048176.1 hypothetical protein [Paludibacterium sp.]